MNLKKILVGIDGIKAKGEIDREVTTIEKDSRKVVEGSMFFAIKGFTTDGTQYIDSAIEKGAKTILVEETTDIKSLNIPEDVTLIVVPDARYAMSNWHPATLFSFKLCEETSITIAWQPSSTICAKYCCSSMLSGVVLSLSSNFLSPL